MFLLSVVYGVGATAQAQIFTNPSGNGDSSFNAQNTYSASSATSDPFDRFIPPAGTPAGDYGIMMLDKVIRAGAHGQGGPLQSALQNLMLAYNTGIMVIASVIIFWMIVSIVIDTAKTGQVGGGRHNMVWLPIRIVFALALLIPLGSNGFSSGQYMVMKLAEWGSNFGSYAWSEYVKGVGEKMAVVSSGRAEYAGEAVVSYSKMWMCRIAVNANLNLISKDANEYVIEKNTSKHDFYGNLASKTVYFERDGSRGMCGSITYPVARTATARNQLGSGLIVAAKR